MTKQIALFSFMILAGCGGADLPSPEVAAPVADDPAESVADLRTDGFDACGGKIEGHWSLRRLFLLEGNAIEGALADICPAATVDYDEDVAGWATFQGGKFATLYRFGGQTTMVIPGSCIANFGASQCSELSTALGASCAVSTGGCTCTQGGSGEWDPMAGTYTYLSGGRVQMDPADAEPYEPFPYCVEGDRLLINDGYGVVMVLRRL